MKTIVSLWFPAFIFLCSLTAVGQEDYDGLIDFQFPAIQHQADPETFVPMDVWYASWYPSSTFPATPATWYHHPSAIVGDTLYTQVVAAAPGNTLMKYDISTGTGGGNWVQGPILPASRVGGDMICCNSKLYYIGGDPGAVSGAGTNTVFEYDPATGIWVTRAPMPVTRTAHGAVCWGDSVIFVIGGPWAATPNHRDVYYYRVASDTWGTIASSLPDNAGRRTFSIGISGNKIIIAGGYNTSGFLKSACVGTIGPDATQISWMTVDDIPTTYAGLSRLGGEAVGDYFFTVGGERAGGGYHDISYIFSFITDTWLPVTAQKPNSVSNVYNAICGKSYPGDTLRIFCPSGYRGNGISNTSFEVMKFHASAGSGTVEGSVVYDNGPGTPLAAVPVRIFAGATLLDSALTDATGHYQLTNLPPGNYSVKAFCNKPWGGGNATDALKILQHFTGQSTLQGLRLGAADVDASGFVNAADALTVAKRFVNMISAFPSGDWISYPFDVSLAAGGNATANLSAICYGDVDGSNIPPPAP
ncbi:MAG TPA: carboxypeptidase regulatory-like domain-containing protein [Bacteroidales bacterium]|nr:carboxypeptidase regulatory-like domain-containing protein [Bacteroidales bacterium]HSA44866.1 carboxypeptidase regulatory-like domain-containing protein [Bacteroidales bacterium]